MSRVAYAALGKRGSFSRDTRYTAPPADAVPAAPTEDAAEQAYRAGYEDGQISTRAECEAQLQAERAARSAIETAFARFDAESGRHLRERLLETVHALCEEAVLPLALDAAGLARRDEGAPRADPRFWTVLARCVHEVGMGQRDGEAAAILREGRRWLADDLELVRDSVAGDLELVPDASVERGGLRVETDDGGVEDGPQQWRRALNEIFDTCRP